MRQKRPKLRSCKQCGNSFMPMNSLQPVCSPACALKFNSEKEVEKRVKEMRAESKKLSFYEDMARKIFQTWVRKRDEHLPCISCGKIHAQQWDGSHYLKAEIYSGVIFHPMNCNKACSYCNLHLEGNLIPYRVGLIKKYGEASVLELENKANETRQYKFTRDELIEIANTYKAKLKNGDFTIAT